MLQATDTKTMGYLILKKRTLFYSTPFAKLLQYRHLQNTNSFMTEVPIIQKPVHRISITSRT